MKKFKSLLPMLIVGAVWWFEGGFVCHSDPRCLLKHKESGLKSSRAIVGDAKTCALQRCNVCCYGKDEAHINDPLKKLLEKKVYRIK